MKRKLLSAVCMALCLVAACANPLTALAAGASEDGEMNMYEHSDFIEKEQPELTEETKQLISLYQKNPTEENYRNLRGIVIENYNVVLARKEEKLAELKIETADKPGGEDIVAEMEEIVQEMYITYWNRINSSMLRFTDPRLMKWSTDNASQYDYIPVMGAGETIFVGRTPVTNAEYAEFVLKTGAKAPDNWTGGAYPEGEEQYPVNFVSARDAEAYCAWLTEADGVNTYRLPSESEWELAAGHMPKDADFNCGISHGRTPVEQYAEVTRGAHGAVDFWGNVWEWTSTVRVGSGGTTTLGVKGGSWSSPRTDCRTEYRGEGRDASVGYEDVGFRVIQVLGGQEPEEKAELVTLAAPVVSAVAPSPGRVALSWQAVDGAEEYQIFEYCEETGLFRMLNLTVETAVTLECPAPNAGYSYVVQPVSHTAVADNVSPEYCVTAANGPFSDIRESDYFYDAVLWANGAGIASGTGAGLFSPSHTCTRGQMVTFLWRACGSPAPASSENPFTDVSPDAYYGQAVLWAVETGITQGVSPAAFLPDSPLSRCEAVTFLYRAAGSPPVKSANPFTDVADTAYYADAVLWAAEHEITVGITPSDFCPLSLCTRAQTVTFLYRTYQ